MALSTYIQAIPNIHRYYPMSVGSSSPLRFADTLASGADFISNNTNVLDDGFAPAPQSSTCACKIQTNVDYIQTNNISLGNQCVISFATYGIDLDVVPANYSVLIANFAADVVVYLANSKVNVYSNGSHYSSTSTYRNGEPLHIILDNNNKAGTLYVNGVSEATFTLIVNPTAYSIGWARTAIPALTASTREVVISELVVINNDTLSQAEVTEFYNQMFADSPTIDDHDERVLMFGPIMYATLNAASSPGVDLVQKNNLVSHNFSPTLQQASLNANFDTAGSYSILYNALSYNQSVLTLDTTTPAILSGAEFPRTISIFFQRVLSGADTIAYIHRSIGFLNLNVLATTGNLQLEYDDEATSPVTVDTGIVVGDGELHHVVLILDETSGNTLLIVDGSDEGVQTGIVFPIGAGSTDGDFYIILGSDNTTQTAGAQYVEQVFALPYAWTATEALTYYNTVVAALISAIVESFSTTDSVSSLKVKVEIINEALGVSATGAYQYKIHPIIIEGLVISPSIATQCMFDQSVIESILLDDQLPFFISAIATESTNFADSSSIGLAVVANAFEVLQLMPSLQSRADFRVTLTVTMLINDYFTNIKTGTITESVSLSDYINTHFSFYMQAIESAIFNDSVLGERYLNILISEGVNLSTDTNTALNIILFLTETVSTLGGLVFDGNEYVVYVHNTKTKGLSEYGNYNFNSYSEGLAASDDGIYIIDGDSGDDDGTLISASVKTGLYDFGTSVLKQIPYVYLGVSTDGTLVLKVTSHTRGVRSEHWYELNETRDSIDTARVKLGRGIKAKYWQFELVNSAGADFDLNQIEPLPLILKRRYNG